MPDFYEVDFLDVESPKSGDAICIRYQLGQQTAIHVVDGGFQATGDSVVSHIRRYYGNPLFIDHVVVTHPDGDHAGGLRTVLESFVIGTLWMLRPWTYAAHLLPRFPTYNSVDRLSSRLRALYPNLAALEDIALERGIPVLEPFQGARIGAFIVTSPSFTHYLDLIVSSERTPESDDAQVGMAGIIAALMRGAKTLALGAWAHEVFSPFETSAENEMSVVQYANLLGDRILLTGDTGRSGLWETIHFAPFAGIPLPGIDRFQVPHHGSRRNVSSETLDRLLGPRLAAPHGNAPRFFSYVSSAKADAHHPRKAVVRAMFHRGGSVYATESRPICFGRNNPNRGWGTVTGAEYPWDQESD